MSGDRSLEGTFRATESFCRAGTSADYQSARRMPSCPTEQQSRHQITGDKIASATNSSRTSPKLRCSDLRLTAKPQDLFIAGQLALFDQPGADPPYQRVEPEDGFNEHVN